MNAPRMRNALTMLYISHQGARGDPWYEIYRMSKAALVRGAFAIQCTLSVPPVISAVSRCSHACSHYQSPIVKYGTVDRSDLCCRRTIRRWNPEARGFRLMYGTRAADEKNFIHTPVSSKSSVLPVYGCYAFGITLEKVDLDLRGAHHGIRSSRTLGSAPFRS